MWQVAAARLAWRAAPSVAFAGFVAVLIVAALLLGGGSSESTQAQPGGGGCGITVAPGTGAPLGSLSAEQVENATAIVGTVHALGLGDDAAVIAVMTALTESTLRNVGFGDTVGPDSRGLFQQRDPWGPLADRMHPVRSTAMFLTGGSALGDAYAEPGLTDIPGWQSLTPWMAAQRVQNSGYPTGSNYAKQHTLATRVVASVTGGNPTVTPDGAVSAAQVCSDPGAVAPAEGWTPLPGNDVGERAVNAAARWNGLPYAWGGGTRTGPSQSIRPSETQVGFDCSGLILHSWWQAAGVALPHSSVAIEAMGTPVTREQARAGDVLSFATNGGTTVSHDGLYDGRGGMWHAPSTGKTISYLPDVFGNSYYAERLVSITRVPAPTGRNQRT